MSQCFSGNWAHLVAKDPKTLFVSVGSKGEVVCCQEFDPRFFASDHIIPDIDKNGVITWQERFAFASKNQKRSLSTFFRGSNYKDTGTASWLGEEPHFKPEVISVGSRSVFNKELEKMKPGDLAVVKISAPWCGPCKEYAPHFKQLARENEGRVLFITIPDGDKPEWEDLVKGFPTVLIFDHRGRHVTVDDRNYPLESKHYLTGAQWIDPDFCLMKIRRIDKPKEWPEVAKNIAPSLLKNRDFILKAIAIDAEILKYASPELQDDREIVEQAVRNDPISLVYASTRLKDNKKIVMIAIRKSGMTYDSASKRLQNDPEVAYEALSENEWIAYKIPKRFLRDRDFMLRVLQRNGLALKNLSPKFKNDPELVKVAVTNNGEAHKFISLRLRRKTDIVLIALRTNPEVYRYLPRKLRSNRNFNLDLMKLNPWIYDVIPKKFQEDEEIAAAAVANDGYLLEYLSERFRDNADIVLLAIKDAPKALRYASERLMEYESFRGEAVRKNPEAIKYIPEKYITDEFVWRMIEQNPRVYIHLEGEDREDLNLIELALDKEPKLFHIALLHLMKQLIHPNPNKRAHAQMIFQDAIENEPHNLMFVPDEIQTIDMVEAAISQKGTLLEYTAHRLRRMGQIVKTAIQNDGDAFEFAPLSFRRTPRTVLHLAKWSPSVIKHADDSLRSDPAFGLKAIEKTGGLGLRYLSDDLRNNPKIVSQAISYAGHLIKHASKRLKNDPEMVMKALKDSVVAFKFASKRLKNDRAFVLRAARINGAVLHYANRRFQKDREIVIAAIKSNPMAYAMASPTLRRDPEIIALAKQLGVPAFHLLTAK